MSVTADGKEINGVTLNEDSFTVQIMDTERADSSAGEKQAELVSEEPGVDHAEIRCRHYERQRS